MVCSDIRSIQKWFQYLTLCINKQELPLRVRRISCISLIKGRNKREGEHMWCFTSVLSVTVRDIETGSKVGNPWKIVFVFMQLFFWCSSFPFPPFNLTLKLEFPSVTEDRDHDTGKLMPSTWKYPFCLALFHFLFGKKKKKCFPGFIVVWCKDNHVLLM